MKYCLLNTLSALLLVLMITGCENAARPEYDPEIEERIRQVENSLAGWVRTQNDSSWNLEARMKHHKITGVAIAVVHNFKTEWVRGYGWADAEKKIPVTAKTLFQAASISKSLNGVGVMKLVQEGKLDLHADINQYLESWKFPYDSVSKNKPVTLSALLSHTAGLTIHGFPGYTRGDSIPSLVQVLDGKRPANTRAVRSFIGPGTRVVYSGGGTTISQLIVMDVTKMPYEKFMQENVLDPMGMTESFYNQPPAKPESKLLATGYKADQTPVKGRYHIYPEQAAAGLWTNPSDLSEYIIETALSYNGKSEKVLKSEFTKKRLEPVMEGAAAGVFIDKKDSALYFSHSGGNEGFTCYYAGDLISGNGMVIMTNSDNGSLASEVANSVSTVYGWKDYYRPVLKTEIEVSDSVLARYAGKYRAGNVVLNTKFEGNRLLINQNSGYWVRTYFTSDSDFFIREFRGDMRFVTDKEGKVKGIEINGMLAAKEK